MPAYVARPSTRYKCTPCFYGNQLTTWQPRSSVQTTTWQPKSSKIIATVTLHNGATTIEFAMRVICGWGNDHLSRDCNSNYMQMGQPPSQSRVTEPLLQGNIHVAAGPVGSVRLWLRVGLKRFVELRKVANRYDRVTES